MFKLNSTELLFITRGLTMILIVNDPLDFCTLQLLRFIVESGEDTHNVSQLEINIT